MNAARCYYLGLGSNLQPDVNIARALYLLQAQFGRLCVWPVVKTEPAVLNTSHDFLNTLVLLRSHLQPEQLKIRLNAIESELGRDRNDPDRARKDRTIDLDILAWQMQPDLTITTTFTEPYMQAVLTSNVCGQRLRFANQYLGHAPATIDTDHAGRHIVVIEDSVNSFFNRAETTFFGE